MAEMVGMTPKKLSGFLNKGPRRLKWRAMKDDWRRETKRLEVERYRARYRIRDLQSKVELILATNKPFELLNPMQIKVLLEAGIISEAYAKELASRRDYWHLKNPNRGLDLLP